MKHPLRSVCLAASMVVLALSQAEAQNVAVYRGGQDNSMTVNTEQGITVIRGPAIASSPPPEEARPSAGSQNHYVGGRNLWTVNQSNGEVSVCRFEYTSRVGVRRVACYDR